MYSFYSRWGTDDGEVEFTIWNFLFFINILKNCKISSENISKT